MALDGTVMSNIHTEAAELLQDAAARIERLGLRRDGGGRVSGLDEPLCVMNTLALAALKGGDGE